MEWLCLRTLTSTCRWTSGIGSCLTNTVVSTVSVLWASTPQVRRHSWAPSCEDFHCSYTPTLGWRWVCCVCIHMFVVYCSQKRGMGDVSSWCWVQWIVSYRMDCDSIIVYSYTVTTDEANFIELQYFLDHTTWHNLYLVMVFVYCLVLVFLCHLLPGLDRSLTFLLTPAQCSAQCWMIQHTPVPSCQRISYTLTHKFCRLSQFLMIAHIVPVVVGWGCAFCCGTVSCTALLQSVLGWLQHLPYAQ